MSMISWNKRLKILLQLQSTVQYNNFFFKNSAVIERYGREISDVIHISIALR